VEYARLAKIDEAAMQAYEDECARLKVECGVSDEAATMGLENACKDVIARILAMRATTTERTAVSIGNYRLLLSMPWGG
jgi:hypothetical protein